MHVTTFYCFIEIDDVDFVQGLIDVACRSESLVGTVLLASEGINATLAHANRANIENAVEDIATILKDVQITPTWSSANQDNPVFHRLRVRTKSEVVSFGRPPHVSNTEPARVGAEDWNELLRDPNTVVLDVRNSYESDIGSFPGAVKPDTEHFRDFPNFAEEQLGEQKQKQIAMFCTGGIRCEKASRWMLANGFENVTLLDRGILGYLADESKQTDLWEGECFVFDQRVSVTRELKQGSMQQCFACRHPVSEAEMQSPHYEHGVSCPHCWNKTTAAQREGFKERVVQEALARSRNTTHVGKDQRES